MKISRIVEFRASKRIYVKWKFNYMNYIHGFFCVVVVVLFSVSLYFRLYGATLNWHLVALQVFMRLNSRENGRLGKGDFGTLKRAYRSLLFMTTNDIEQTIFNKRPRNEKNKIERATTKQMAKARKRKNSDTEKKRKRKKANIINARSNETTPKKKAFERNKDKIKLNFINGLQSKVDFALEKMFGKKSNKREKKNTFSNLFGFVHLNRSASLSLSSSI